MKQEAKDLTLQAIYSAPLGLWAWVSGLTLNEKLALAMFVVQLAYLLRKWWREETTAGLAMKRMAGRRVSRGVTMDETSGER